ncbi:SID1 transmembrane member 2 [Cichlidogyrus casuarinus]|uniref:SID1 transmembrane member 2 n=1 Tax=Cichlidogyrus casuarinus TaxID=1844966 RepID=A0ABD2QDR6_9PLAT
MAFSIEDFTVPEEQVRTAKEVFKRFDKRSQEKISTNDLGPAFRALNLGIRADQLKEWADEVDEDATGFIDMQGFLTVYAKKLREDQDEKDLREAFRVLDKNKRGEIDVEDLRWILKGLGDDLTEEEIDDMIRDTDTDGSGFVDFDEFYKLMTSDYNSDTQGLQIDTPVIPFLQRTVSRTICPFYLDSLLISESKDKHVVVELSTFVPEDRRVNYSLRADIVDKFLIPFHTPVDVALTASQPQFFMFEYPKNHDSVSVKLDSEDTFCLVFSIQEAQCPVDDLLGNVKYSGIYQTVTKRGSMTITNSVMKDKFFVVLVLKSTDFSCNGISEIVSNEAYRNVLTFQHPLQAHQRTKKVHEKPNKIKVADHTVGGQEALLLAHIWCREFLHDHLSDRGDLHVFVSLLVGVCSLICLILHLSDKNERFINSNRATRALFSEYHRLSSNAESQLPSNLSNTNADQTQKPEQENEKNVLHRGGENSIAPSNVEPDSPVSAPRTKFPNRKRKNSNGSVSTSMQIGSASIAVGEIIQELTSAVSATVSSAVSQSKRRNSDPKNPAEDANASSPTRRSYGSRDKHRQSHRGLFSSSDEEDLHPLSPSTANKTRRHSVVVGRRADGTKVVQPDSFPHDAENGRTSKTSVNYSPPDPNWDMHEIEQQTEGGLMLETTNRNVARLNRTLYVSELSRKRYSTLNRKYLLYFWYLIIISIFYGLPVMQLVMTYQKAIHDTGNEDICYYNFECANPLGFFTAFNNIISNIGYVMLGILFLIITVRRDILQKRVNRLHKHYANNFGLPQHYGLFYAMSLALFMEGVMSACYHVCPSYSNFQFDTAYMYILAMILMLKIYQTRHPDINASAHSTYMLIALVICIGFSGVMIIFFAIAQMYGGETFWVFFTIVFLLLSVCLTAEIYYMGQWNFDLCLPRRIYNLIRVDGLGCLRPMYVERMLLLLIANIVNFSFAGWGIYWRPHDFSTFLLAIFMINLIMYFLFYVIMKYRHGEKLHFLSIVYLSLAGICWGVSLYFFIERATTWQMTPAQSRAINQPCILLDFYDSHDVWHFLSATSMFFSFMGLMNLDDDLIYTPRNEIAVF